jgi:hypothetical protein
VSPRLAVVPELESELDELFGRPLAEFTSARNELARRLKKAGQDDAAARVQALKKPSVPVWAVNQLARRHPDEVEELVSAGEKLRKAQEAAFQGGGREAVREATAAERTAARTLTRLAHELLEAEGRPATRAVTDRIGSLLRAAAVNPEAGELLAAGRLTEEVESTGFGAVAGIAPTRPPRPRAKPRPKEDVERQRREQELRRLQARADQLDRRAAEAEARAERAEQAAAEAREKAEAARAEADEAVTALEAARE